MFRQSPLFEFRHGTHACVFYRSDDALLEVLTPYIAKGLIQGERCFCAQRPEILKRLVYDLMFLGIDTDKEIKRGALELHTEDDVYFPNKQFEPAIMMNMLVRSIQQARDHGFAAFRSAGDLSWAVRGRNECDNVLGYEKMVSTYYPGRPAIGLCQYPVSDFPAPVLERVLQNHRMHLSDTAPNSYHSSIHIHYDQCDAEVVADKYITNPRYYYVVQRHQPREIVGWGISPTFDGATANVDQLATKANQSGFSSFTNG
jgi:hypothetical protein